MRRIFIAASEAGDWRGLLAKPELHWKTGYSAKTLAYCWQEADPGFPECVQSVFKASLFPLFNNLELLVAFPEYRTPLPGGRRPSQSDIFILAKGDNELISITIEGKVSEGFGQPVAEWIERDDGGKAERLQFLLRELGLKERQVGNVPYQLLHRTASAILEAKNFAATNASMLVHSFPKDDDRLKGSFEQYQRFLQAFGLHGEPDSILYAKNISGINLYLGWVNGDKKYLEK